MRKAKCHHRWSKKSEEDRGLQLWWMSVVDIIHTCPLCGRVRVTRRMRKAKIKEE